MSLGRLIIVARVADFAAVRATDAYAHAKFIGYGTDAAPLLQATGLSARIDEGMIELADVEARHDPPRTHDLPCLTPQTTAAQEPS